MLSWVLCKFRHRVITLLSMVLFGKSLPISFVATHHHGRKGVVPTRGGVTSALGVNDRGVIHASDTSARSHA